MTKRCGKRSSSAARARRRRRSLPLGGRLAVALFAVVAVALAMRQLARSPRDERPARRPLLSEKPVPAPAPHTGPGPTPVSALPGQHDEPDLQGADARALLRREADAILKAIEAGRAFGREANSVVEAHFAIGTGHWVVREATAPGVAPKFLAASPAPAAGQAAGVAGAEGWRFRAFRGPEGERLEPVFVFFPDGSVQGGVAEMGWDHAIGVIRLDPSGKVAFERPSALPPAAPSLPLATPPPKDRDVGDDARDAKNPSDGKGERDDKDPKDKKAPSDIASAKNQEDRDDNGAQAPADGKGANAPEEKNAAAH